MTTQPPLNVSQLIGRKRDGAAHSAAELSALIAAYTRGDVPDYQMAAWLMAVVWRGMTTDEASALTLAIRIPRFAGRPLRLVRSF